MAEMIAKDTLLGPERNPARAIDWDQCDRGRSSGRAATLLQIRRRIHGRNRPDASISETPLPRGRHPYTVRASGPNDRNLTKGKIASRLAHPEADVECYVQAMIRIDRQTEGEARVWQVDRLGRRYGRIRHEIQRLKQMDEASGDAPDSQIS